MRSDASLDKPLSLAEVTQLEDFLEFGGSDGVGEILFVGVDEESSVLEVVVAEGVFKFSSSFLDTGAVGAVDNINNTIGVLVVVTPERTEASLTTDVKTLELEVLVFDGVDVETDCGDCGLGFAKLELTQTSRFPSRIKTDHHYTDVTLGENKVPESRKFTTHVEKKCKKC